MNGKISAFLKYTNLFITAYITVLLALSYFYPVNILFIILLMCFSLLLSNARKDLFIDDLIKSESDGAIK